MFLENRGDDDNVHFESQLVEMVMKYDDKSDQSFTRLGLTASDVLLVTIYFPEITKNNFDEPLPPESDERFRRHKYALAIIDSVEYAGNRRARFNICINLPFKSNADDNPLKYKVWHAIKVAK